MSPKQLKCPTCNRRRYQKFFPFLPENKSCCTCLEICVTCRVNVSGNPDDFLNQNGVCTTCVGMTYQQRFRSDLTRTAAPTPLGLALCSMRRRGEQSYLTRTPTWTVQECESIKKFCIASDLITYKWEKIIFGPRPSHRFQRTIWQNWYDPSKGPDPNCSRSQLPPSLHLFITQIELALPRMLYLTVKLLKSTPSTTAQQTVHADDHCLRQHALDGHRVQYQDASYSFLFALEGDMKTNPTRIIRNLAGRQSIIRPGAFIVMRGDYLHAGAAYRKDNYRLFIAVGTAKFINAGDRVGVVKATNP